MALLVLGIVGSASGQSAAPTARVPLGGGGVSGSFGNPGDAYLSFAIAGADLQLIEGSVASYAGAWSGGPITVSGEMIVARAAGSVSYVTMSANLGDKSWGWPPAGEDGKVLGRTVSQPFSLTFDVPPDYQGSHVTGYVRLDVCGGVCDVYEVDFRISVGAGATGSGTECKSPAGGGDVCPPVARAFAPRAIVKPGKRVSLEFSVEDDSAVATPHLVLYQGGTELWTVSPGAVRASGKREAATFQLDASLVGPLSFCVWAEDAAGNRSARSPKSSCARIPLLVPSSPNAAAYRHLTTFMNQYNKSRFARVAALGKLTLYRTLLGLTVKIDPTLKARASYDPVSKSITFSKDPRTLKRGGLKFGETVWHELTHAIEDEHGDIGAFDTKLYAERNIEYMTYVAGVALPVLERMEWKAKAGASVAKLRKFWKAYLKKMAAARKLPETVKYPPNLKRLGTWFGFKADAYAIRNFYRSGKALPGAAGAKLRAAVR